MIVDSTVGPTRVTLAVWLAFALSSLPLWHAARAQEAPRIEADAGGFSLSSADRAFRLRLRGLVQFDGRLFTNDSAQDEDSEWLIRRIRPTFEGEFGERVSFRIMPDFAGGTAQLIDGYVEAKLGSGNVALRAGKFKAPVGLERLQSANDLRIIERSIVTDLLPNRDIGVQLSGGRRLMWQAGLFNGVNDGRSADADDDGNQELAVRLFAEPFDPDHRRALLGIGVGATYGSRDGSPALPLLVGYRTPGQKTVFQYRGGADGTFADGDRLRVSPQFYWYSGPVGFLGEWARVRQDVRRIGADFDRCARLDQEAWQVTAEWFVTGEAAGYRDPNAVDAVQLVARVSELRIDEESFAAGAASFADPAAAVSRARTWALGVNWFPLAGLKATAAYHLTQFTGGAATGDRPDERVLFLRLQHRF